MTEVETAGLMIDKLVGLRLMSCRFSRGSYDFEFEGMVDGEHKTYTASTAYSASGVGSPHEDALANISCQVWDLLERTLVSVQLEQLDEIDRAVFQFEGGKTLLVWSQGAAPDNLLIIREQQSGAWSAF